MQSPQPLVDSCERDPMLPNPGTLELERLMGGLEERLGNLSPKQRYLAEGILKTVRRTGRASEKQREQILRLATLSKKPFRAETRHKTVGNRGYWDGHRHVSASEQASGARRAIAEENARAAMTDEEFAAWRKQRAFYDDVVRPARQRKARAASEVQHHATARARNLQAALPSIDQPHLKPRAGLIACLRRRRDHLLRAPYQWHVRPDLDWTRRALRAELLAHYRDRAQARMPITDAAE